MVSFGIIRQVFVLLLTGLIPILLLPLSPLLGFLLSPVTVISQMITTVNIGMLYGIANAIIILNLSAFIFGLSGMLAIVCALVCLGMFLAKGLLYKASIIDIFLISIGLVTLLAILVLGVFSYHTANMNPFTYIYNELAGRWDTLLESNAASQTLGSSMDGLEPLVFFKWVSFLFPSFLISILAWEGFAAISIANHYKLIQGIMFMKEASKINFADYWVWPLIVSGFFIILFPSLIVKVLAANVLIIVATIFFYRGLMLTLVVLERMGFSFIIKAAIVFLHVLLFPLTLIAFLTGLLDVWLKLMEKIETTPKET